MSRTYDLQAVLFPCTSIGVSFYKCYEELQDMQEKLNVYHPLTNNINMLYKQYEEFKVAKFLGLGLGLKNVEQYPF